MTTNIGHRLHVEIAEAQALLGNMRDVLGDDAELIAATIDGETNLNELIASAAARCLELEALIEGIAALAERLSGRKDRLAKQRVQLREMIAVAMETAGQKRIELPIASITLKAVAPKVEVTSESDIPARFWKPQEPKLDKVALLRELKDHAVAGATLSNGGMTVQIKGA